MPGQGNGKIAFGSLDDAQVILLDGANGELGGAVSSAKVLVSESLTISVASTRVPTIFSRTFVFFSMI